MTTPVITSVSVDPRDGEADPASGDGVAPNGDESSSDSKGEPGEPSGDGTVGSVVPVPVSVEGEADDDALGLGLPVSSAAAGDGVSSDPARHVASTSNVGEARCMVQR
jgi:hypothetical protein